MITIVVAGNAGKDAEVKSTPSGDTFCVFSMAGKAGYGDKAQSVWFDVTKWGKGAEGLAGYIRKGTPLTVSGELSTREHDGKTYLQLRADRIALQGGKQGGAPTHRNKDGFGGNTAADDLDEDCPF